MKKNLVRLISTLFLSIMLVSNAFATIPVPGSGINEEYTLLTKEQIQQEEAKFKVAKEYVADKMKKLKSSNTITPDSVIVDGNSHYNSVGTFRQSQSYTCGPASARNLINGYVYINGGTVPSESTLSTALGTTTSGTSFSATPWQNTLNTYASGNNYLLTWASTNWNTNLATRVISTIDKPGCYNVIGDLYNGATSTPIHSVYANGAAHYICIYGYNNSDGYYYVSDSNSAAPVTYTTPYINMANSTQQRGIVW